METLASPQLIVAGAPMESLLSWGELKVTHRVSDRGVGSWEARWGVVRHSLRRHPRLAGRVPVHVRLGGVDVWSGVLPQANTDADEFVAIGNLRDGETTECLNSAGYLTTVADVAFDEAATRGAVSWLRAGSIKATAYGAPDGGASTDNPEVGSLSRLLDGVATEQQKYWQVAPSGLVSMVELTEANPAVHILPGVTELGATADEQVDRLFVGYTSTSGGYFRVNSYPDTTPQGGTEVRIDLRPLGAISSARATAIAEGIWSRTRGRGGWTNGYTLAREEFTTAGGTRAHPGLIWAGMAMSGRGAPDPRDDTLASTNTVIGESVWDVDATELQLNPMDMVANTLEAVLEDVAPGAVVMN